MAYILTDGGSGIVTYPYSINLLRSDNPNVSLPVSPTEEQLAEWNVYSVIKVDQPTVDTLLEYITEGTPLLVGSDWTQVWVVNQYTSEEQVEVYNDFVATAQNQARVLFEETNKHITQSLTEGLELTPELIAYRAALMDLSALTGYPNNIEWPTAPTEYFVGAGATKIASIEAENIAVNGTMTLGSTPLTGDSAATKQYVDGRVAGARYLVSNTATENGTVTFNETNADDVTEIKLSINPANDYDISNALDKLIAANTESVVTVTDAADNNSSVKYIVESITKDIPNGFVYTYRGFKAVYSRVWGDDPNINNIIFYKQEANVSLNAIDGDTDTEEFGITNASASDTFAILNIYGQDYSNPTSVSEITNAAKAFIDNVIYTGESISSAEQANNNFYSSYSAIAANITSGLYQDLEDIDLSNNSISDGGDDQYDDGNYINTNLESEINYGGGEVVAGSTAFGLSSEYVSMYQDSLWAMFVTGAEIESFGITGERGADGDGTEEHGFLVVDIATPTQQEIDSAPYKLTVEFLEGSPSINLTGNIVVDVDYSRLKPISRETIWNSPNGSEWKTVDVSGGRVVSYSPLEEISDNSYDYVGNSGSTAGELTAITSGPYTDVNYISVLGSFDSELYTQLSAASDNGGLVNQPIYINNIEVSTMNGNWGANTTHISIGINGLATYNDGDAVRISYGVYNESGYVDIAAANINPANIIIGSSRVLDTSSQPHVVTGFNQGDYGSGEVIRIYYEGSFAQPPGGNVDINLFTPETNNLWIDPETDFGISPNQLRGFSLDYHIYSGDAGTMIGKIIVAIDGNPRVTNIVAASGSSDLNAIDIESYNDTWYNNKGLTFKRTDYESDTLMIQWSGKAFYSPEWRD